MSKRQIDKQVSFAAKDAESQTATGAVLVPNEVDRQRDFLRPPAVQRLFADAFDNGVMHAAFPDDAAETIRNEVIGEPEKIGDEEYAAGTWVLSRRYNDDRLWQLVADGVLDGFSIGGEITAEVSHEAGEVPADIRFPADVEQGAATEIHDGEINEVSDVDIPAVPRAAHAEKACAEKNVLEEAEGEEEFVALMQDRGHDEEDARRLYDYMTDVAGKSQNNMTRPDNRPDKIDVDDETLGKRIKSLLFGDGNTTDDAAPDDSPEDADKYVAEAAQTLKEGRPLNTQNREALMAAHDAIESALVTDMQFEMNRFSDNGEYAFDIESFGKSDDTNKTEAEDAETEDKDNNTDMADENHEGDTPKWAETLIDKVEQIDKRVDGIEDDDEKSFEDAPDWAQDVAEKVDELDDRVDKLSKTTADTEQATGDEKNGEVNDEVEAFKQGLTPGGQ